MSGKLELTSSYRVDEAVSSPLRLVADNPTVSALYWKSDYTISVASVFVLWMVSMYASSLVSCS